MRAHAGRDARHAVSTHWKTATYTTWAEAVSSLAEGMTLTAPCNPTGAGGDWTTHKIRFHPDGSVTMLDHPDYVVDVDAELMLQALGGTMPACVAAVVYLTSGKTAPAGISCRNTINTRFRALHTAMAWAHDPTADWTPQFMEARLKYGITPTVVAAWTAQGWDVEKALVFQQQGAPIHIANAWRTAGNTTRRAAQLAARGEFPDNEERWTRAGFTPARSARWRKSALPPEVAIEWDRMNVAPTDAEGILARIASGHAPESLDTVKQWVIAGVRPNDVFGWLDYGCPLDEAVAWSRAGLSPFEYRTFAQHNDDFPAQALLPHTVAAFRKAGVPVVLHTMLDLVESGITSQRYRRAVRGLFDPEGADLRVGLQREARAHPENWGFSFAEDEDATGLRYRRFCRQGTIGPVNYIRFWLDRNPTAFAD